MTPDEVVDGLIRIGVPMKRRTLLNYEIWGLIPQPKRGAKRGGRWVDYPEVAIYEAYAAYKLLHGLYGDHLGAEIGNKPPKINIESIVYSRKIVRELSEQGKLMQPKTTAVLSESPTQRYIDFVMVLWKLLVEEAKSELIKSPA